MLVSRKLYYTKIYVALENFAGAADFTKIWSKDYLKTYTKIWTKDYSVDYIKTYTKI